MRGLRILLVMLSLLVAALIFRAAPTLASEEEKPLARDYALVRAPAAPAQQTDASTAATSAPMAPGVRSTLWRMG